MKNSLKIIIGLFVLSTFYFVLSTVFATCTLSPDHYLCNDTETCDLVGGCMCETNLIANGQTCNFFVPGTVTLDNVSAYAISGSLVNFRFTVSSNSGDKYFKLDLPYNNDYGIRFLNSSEDPLNKFLILLGFQNSPVFLIHSGENKTYIITGQIFTNDWSLPVLDFMGKIGDDQDVTLIDRSATGSISPIAELFVTKTLVGSGPGFSGDIVTYQIQLQNIGSLADNGITFFDTFPLAYLNLPTATFDGTAYAYNKLNLPNTFVWSGNYLNLNPGEAVTIDIFSPMTSGYPVGTSIVNSCDVTSSNPQFSVNNKSASATATVIPYFDLGIIDAVPISIQPKISGDQAAFTISYHNTGNIQATNAILTATISGTNIFGATYNIGDVLNSTSSSITITGTVNNNYAPGTSICLDVTISAAGEVGPTSNNSISNICYTIGTISDLVINSSITNPNDLETLNSGSNITYTIVVTNTGTADATGVIIKYSFPSQLSTASGNNLIWNVPAITAGQTISYPVVAKIEMYPDAGMDLITSGTVTTTSRELTTANNQTILTTHLLGLADVYVSQTMLPINGFLAGTPVVFVVTYGNAGGKTANAVAINDTISSLLTTPTTSWNIGNLAPGSGGTIVVTGTMLSNLNIGDILSNTVTIFTTTEQVSTDNDTSTITGAVPEIDGLYITVTASNISNPNLNLLSTLSSYGVTGNKTIGAVSGDMVVFTIAYGNIGNTSGTSANISLGGYAQGLVPASATNFAAGNLNYNNTGTFTITGIIGPQNYIGISPVATIVYNVNKSKTDIFNIIEPVRCGDAIIAGSEQCDTNGNLGVLPGQSCDPVSCQLFTDYVENVVELDYTYTIGSITGSGHTQASSRFDLPRAYCSSLTQGSSSENNGVITIPFTCNGVNAGSNTLIRIDCGNGIILSGYGSSLVGACSYSGFAGTTASCLVGLETVATGACIQSVAGGQCEVIPLDGDIVFIDEYGYGFAPVICEKPDGTEINNPEIDCGNNGDYDRNDRICEYKITSSLPKIRTITCEGEGLICDAEVILDEGLRGICGDGEIDTYEQCDDGKYNGTSSSNCDSDCKLKGITPPVCFSVNNGNLSVQKGEYMPLGRRLETGKTTDKCDGSSTYKKAIRDSFVCDFEVKNANETKTFHIDDCYNDPTLPSLIKNILPVNVQSKYIMNYLKPSQRSNDFDYFGEYKLALTSISYKYCDKDGDEVDGEQGGRVCETNFTVTQPYLAQKSIFGLLPKSTDINLDNYIDMNGNELIKSTDLEDIMTIDASDYEGGNEVTTLANNFISKYEKLALDTTRNNIKVKKVPNQSILIIDGNNGNPLVIDGKSSTAPFTIIVKNTDLVIKGDVSVNGMFLVKNGDIKFDTDCSKTQEVKGIFIAIDGSFTSDKVANTSLSNSRCNRGGLYIKGVLIGDGIQDLVKERRSQLNGWFYGAGSESSIKASRRNKIFNGAAVLIEYSPSLRSNLPPGASEFTKALEVYKK